MFVFEYSLCGFLLIESVERDRRDDFVRFIGYL